MPDHFTRAALPAGTIEALQRATSAVTLPAIIQIRQNVGQVLQAHVAWLDDVNRSLANVAPVLRSLESARATITAQLAAAMPGIVDTLRGAIPSNLREAKTRWTIEQLNQLMLDEGLPIAWVPRTSILDRVLVAESPAARRAIYGRSWRQIVDDCAELVARAESVEMQPYVFFIAKAIEGLRAGHHELAQAMIMNTFDTMLQHRFPARVRRMLVDTSEPLDTDELTFRMYFAACSIWSLHHRYYPAKGDQIPRYLNRHASVHGVSRRQYSQVNAVLALAHVTGLLWFLDTQFSRRQRLKA